MRQINCYIPIKVCISGPLTDTQLDQLGETIVRTVSARLAFAERTVMAALGSRTPPAAADHARWMPTAYDPKAQRYVVPSYEGARGQASVEVKAAGQSTAPGSVRKSDKAQAQPGVVPPPAELDKARAREAVQRTPASDIAKQWKARREEFLAVADDPANALDGHQHFQIWFQYWIEQLNAAVENEKQIRKAVWQADKVAYAKNKDLFDIGGKRDALGPEYQKAADQLDTCNVFLTEQTTILNWLEDWVNAAHHRVTFKQVNEKTLAEAKLRGYFEQFIEPLIYGALGAATLRAPGEPLTVEPEMPKTGPKPLQTPKAEPEPKPAETPLAATPPKPAPTPEAVPPGAARAVQPMQPTPEEYARVAQKDIGAALKAAEELMQNPGTIYNHEVRQGGLGAIAQSSTLKAGGGTSAFGGGDAVRAHFGSAKRITKVAVIEFQTSVKGSPRPYIEGVGATWNSGGRDSPIAGELPIKIVRIRFPDGRIATPGSGGQFNVRYPDGTLKVVDATDLE